MKIGYFSLLLCLCAALKQRLAYGTPGPVVEAIQSCISNCFPLRLFPGFELGFDPYCNQRRDLALAFINCNHECYFNLGTPTDPLLTSEMSCLSQNGVYTCTEFDFCEQIENRVLAFGGDLQLRYENTMPPSTSPIPFDPSERRRLADGSFGDWNALDSQDDTPINLQVGAFRSLQVETLNPGSVFNDQPNNGLGFNAEEPICSTTCAELYASPFQTCLRTCEISRLSETVGATPAEVTCVERETLLKQIIECNHACYEAHGGAEGGLDGEGPECLGVGVFPYSCTTVDLCEGARERVVVPPSTAFGISYTPVFPEEFISGNIFAFSSGVNFEDSETCATTCDALLVSSETILDEGVTGTTEAVQGGVAGTVVVTTTTTLLGGAGGSSAAGLGTLQTSGGIQSLFQTGGIDVAEGATEGIASQVKKKEASTRLLDASAVESAKAAATSMLGSCWPYLIVFIQFIAVFAKFLLLGLSVAAAVAYTDILPTVEAELNPAKVLTARFSPQNELLPLRLDAWLGPSLVANTGALGVVGEEICLDAGITCVDEATFTSDPVGPYTVEFLVRAIPNDTFQFLQYALLMDVAMAVVALIFVLYFSPLVRRIPCVKNSKCEGPKISHNQSNLFVFAVIVPSLALSIYVLSQVIKDDLYGTSTVGWVTDEGTNQSLRVVATREFAQDGASFVDTSYGNTTECMNQTRFDVLRPLLEAKQTETFFHCEVAAIIFDDINDCISYNCPGPLLINSLAWFRSLTAAMTNDVVIPNLLIDLLLTGAELLGLAVAFYFFIRKRNKLKKAKDGKATDDDTKEV